MVGAEFWVIRPADDDIAEYEFAPALCTSGQGSPGGIATTKLARHAGRHERQAQYEIGRHLAGERVEIPLGENIQPGTSQLNDIAHLPFLAFHVIESIVDPLRTFEALVNMRCMDDCNPCSMMEYGTE